MHFCKKKIKKIKIGLHNFKCSNLLLMLYSLYIFFPHSISVYSHRVRKSNFFWFYISLRSDKTRGSTQIIYFGQVIMVIT